MSARRQFRPSDAWSLEDRIALSTVSAAVAPQSLVVVLRGQYATTVQHGVDTASEVLKLSGSSAVPGFGRFAVHGALSNNVVFPNHFGPTTGTAVVNSPNHPGSATLALSGPYANLAPTSPEVVHLTFTVQNATGQFASYNGDHGTIDLTLSGGRVGNGHLSQTSMSHGTFTLVLRQS